MKVLVPLVAVVALVAGCGGESENEADAADATTTAEAAGAEGGEGENHGELEPPPAGPGTWTTFDMNGTEITADVPTQSDDPRVQQIEKFRQQYDAPPQTYIAVELDNSQGVEATGIFTTLQVVTEDGEQVSFSHPAEMDNWVEEYAFDSGGPDLHAWYEEVYDNQEIMPGAKGTTVLSTEEVPDLTVARVFIDDGFGEHAELFKADDGNE